MSVSLQQATLYTITQHHNEVEFEVSDLEDFYVLDYDATYRDLLLLYCTFYCQM